MCTPVGDNKAEGLVVSKLYTHSRIHLIVAVKEAVILLPISFLAELLTIKSHGNLILVDVFSS